MSRLSSLVVVLLGLLAAPACSFGEPGACETEGEDSFACYCEQNPGNCQTEPDTAQPTSDADR